MNKNYYYRYLTKEDHLHKQCINWIEYQYPELIWYHSPSEGKRSRFEQFKFKWLGGSRRAGFPDLAIFNEFMPFNGLAVEFKVIYDNGKKNYPSPNQKKWLKDLTVIGWMSEVIYTFEDFQKLIKECYG